MFPRVFMVGEDGKTEEMEEGERAKEARLVWRPSY